MLPDSPTASGPARLPLKAIVGAAEPTIAFDARRPWSWLRAWIVREQAARRRHPKLTNAYLTSTPCTQT
jgi:hypothetical protein